MRRIASFSLGLGTLLLAGSAAAVEYVNDPLTEASHPGRGSQGGTFAPNGWTTTSGTDAVWYEIPDALPSGHIELKVTGVSTESTLLGADHDIFTMYQAPSGQAEPIAYSPYFRNNDFKAFTRIFGVQEPGRAGAMKMEFVLCPRGDPWYHDEPCPADCGKNDLAYANGMDKDIGWDPGAWYQIGITWGNGSMAFFRDGAQLAAIAYDGTYAPAPMRVRLGSPRHGISDVAYMPVGLTFKDVLVTGDPGAMTPVCEPPVMPDGGAGGGSPDGGTTTEMEYGVLQDVTGASWSAGVFEDVADLNVEGDGSAPTGVVYLRFPAIAGNVTRATLRLHTQAYPSAAGGSGVVYSVADGTWSETTLTWANRPPYGAAPYGAAQPVTPDVDVDWDVTELVAAGLVNFAIVSTDTDGAHYQSKEAGDGTHGPKLLVEIGPDLPDGGTGGAGGSTATTGSGGSTGTAGSAGNAGNAGSAGDAGSGAGSGCACDVGGAPATPIAALGVMGAWLAWASRRSRRRKRSGRIL